jgi:hypothetical protein
MDDLAFFILFSLNSDIRRLNEESLLRFYHSKLLRYSRQEISFEECMKDYQQSLVAALVQCIASLDVYLQCLPSQLQGKELLEQCDDQQKNILNRLIYAIEDVILLHNI